MISLMIFKISPRSIEKNFFFYRRELFLTDFICKYKSCFMEDFGEVTVLYK